jgi:hypothetical protein
MTRLLSRSGQPNDVLGLSADGCERDRPHTREIPLRASLLAEDDPFVSKKEFYRQLRADIGTAQFDAARREAHRVAELIDVLPGAMDAATSDLWRQVAIDSFFGYVRALIEFLNIKPSTWPSDLTASDVLGVTFAPTYPDKYGKGRLEGVWEMSTQHQSHFTIARAALLPLSRADLDQFADEVLDVWDQFAQASKNHPDAPVRASFSMYR